MDCSFCLIPSLHFSSGTVFDDKVESHEICGLNHDNDVYLVQTGHGSSRTRNFFNTVSRHMIAVRTELYSAHGFNTNFSRFTKIETQLSKRYLKRVSANLILPALAAFYGLEKNPYHL